MPAKMRFLALSYELARVELLAEWRSRQVVTTMALLMGLAVVTFGFAGRADGAHLAVPAFWVSLLLATVAGTTQIRGRLEDSSVDEAWLLSGAARTAVFTGRAAAVFVLLVVIAALDFSLVALFFGAGPLGSPMGFGALGMLGCLGLAFVSTTLSLTLTRGTVLGGQLLPLVLLAASAPLAWFGARGSLGLAAADPRAGWTHGAIGVLALVWATVGVLVACRARAR
jgi:ABC-type transport system involved in cytochrome c biogenesis permease component